MPHKPIDVPRPLPAKPTRLLDQFRAWLRNHHYRYATEQTYLHWVIAYIRFHKRRHPKEMGRPEMEEFLSHLVLRRHCSISTQKIALNALNCFYRKFLKIDYEPLAFRQPRRGPRIPVVFSTTEAKDVIRQLEDPYRLMAEVMYGAGLRVIEMLRLRIKDIDFGQHQIIVREGKGNKDRVTVLPDVLEERLQGQIELAREYYAQDRKSGVGPAWMPDALARKYKSEASQLGWQFIFPSKEPALDPQTGIVRRHHHHPDTIRKHIKRAAQACGITKV